MKKTSPAPEKPAPPLPDVRVRDEVYFHINNEPHEGRVLATGQHGITVHHEGKPRSVRWEHLLGHKKRAVTKMQIVAHGEDGAIVKDESGRRQFLAGYAPRDKSEPTGSATRRPKERTMAKSEPMVLLFGDAAKLKAL